MIRLFTAIEIPEAEQERLSALEVPLAGARWIDMDDMHLTLRFIGDVEEPTARDFVERLAEIEHAPFRLKLNGIAAFGGEKPRSLHATVAASEPLRRLQMAHELAAKAAECPPERRKFTPHVTIARLKGTRTHEVAAFLSGCGGDQGEAFEVNTFALMSARTGRGGGPYIVEERFVLSAVPISSIRDKPIGEADTD